MGRWAGSRSPPPRRGPEKRGESAGGGDRPGQGATGRAARRAQGEKGGRGREEPEDERGDRGRSGAREAGAPHDPQGALRTRDRRRGAGRDALEPGGEVREEPGGAPRGARQAGAEELVHGGQEVEVDGQ